MATIEGIYIFNKIGIYIFKKQESKTAIKLNLNQVI